MCMYVREEERVAFSYSCLSASMVCRSEASRCLDHAEASASFSTKKGGVKKDLLLSNMAEVWVGGGHPGPMWLVN